MDRPTEEYSKLLQREFPDLRLEPDKQLCPMYDPMSVAILPETEWDMPLWRLTDNFSEEHIM